ncbi:MAG TPA: hypothetical protein VGE77_10235 [Nocardioides sp.]
MTAPCPRRPSRALLRAVAPVVLPLAFTACTGGDGDEPDRGDSLPTVTENAAFAEAVCAEQPAGLVDLLATEDVETIPPDQLTVADPGSAATAYVACGWIDTATYRRQVNVELYPDAPEVAPLVADVPWLTCTPLEVAGYDVAQACAPTPGDAAEDDGTALAAPIAELRAAVARDGRTLLCAYRVGWDTATGETAPDLTGLVPAFTEVCADVLATAGA